jgi:hypothetical protein
MARDIILAGIPRGGTSLACMLLNSVQDTIALIEPFKIGELHRQANPEKMVAWLKNALSEARSNLLESGTALSKGIGGELVSNLFEDAPSGNAPRKTIASLQPISFPKPNCGNFDLIVKHPNVFTVLLPLLRNHFECFSIVRNPLAVILSWDSTHADWRSGRVPAAENFDGTLRAGLHQKESVADRQLLILSRYFEVTKNSLSLKHIIRYEDIISSGGKGLGVVVPGAGELNSPLTNRNTNPVYDRAKVRMWTERLLGCADDWLPLYSKEDIEELAALLK